MNETPIYRFSCDAMAAAFEVAIRGEEKDYARQAAAAALAEAPRLEGELSRFIGYSDVSRINRLRAGESARVGVAAFECLQLARQVYDDTGGAFDVTLGTGMEHLRIDEADHAVGVERDGIAIDLGGIGKGYAVDRVAELLRDWSIEDALIHAGESTALSIGLWSVSVRDPETQSGILEREQLQDRALSGSGTALQGRHIIDPRTGKPVEGTLAAWASAPIAALSDALSTAFMVMEPEEVEHYCERHADAGALLLLDKKGGGRVSRFGKWEP